MANSRRPIFELHIRPMFRMLDHVHMSRLAANKRIDFADYQQVRDKSVKIISLLNDSSPMPTRGTGGPWPQEWIDLFVRWTQTGFGRLAKPTGLNFKLVLDAPDRYTLSCDVNRPDSSATAWFDVQQAQPDAQIYEVVMEQVDGTAPAPGTVPIEEHIRGPLTVAEIVVIDAAGEHRLALPTS
jgi:hypothetical protein